jgi:pimeloyl-ACP methyl ester carboxylesterase
MEPDAQSLSREHVTDDFVDRLLEIANRPEHVEAAERVAGLREPVWMPSILSARRQTLADLDERGLPVPTLVVWAADDLSAPLPLAYSLFERVRAKTEFAELHVIARSGHYVFREQPAAFTRIVAAFCGGRP